MNSAVVASWNIQLVALSFLISVVGSFAALTAANRIRRADGSLDFANLATAGFAMGGIGVWSMHFVGMAALKLDVATGYSLTETLISLVAAVVAATLALMYVAKDAHSLKRIVGAGAVLGVGVAVMHYLGMFGVRFNGYVQWNYAVVGVSVLIAVVAATAALWLAFNTHTWTLRGLAAVLMGVAVCTMHYTGMSAADYVCTSANRRLFPIGWGVIGASDLPTVVIAVSLTIALLILVDQVVQRMQSSRGQQADPARG